MIGRGLDRRGYPVAAVMVPRAVYKPWLERRENSIEVAIHASRPYVVARAPPRLLQPGGWAVASPVVLVSLQVPWR